MTTSTSKKRVKRLRAAMQPADLEETFVIAILNPYPETDDDKRLVDREIKRRFPKVQSLVILPSNGRDDDNASGNVVIDYRTLKGAKTHDSQQQTKT